MAEEISVGTAGGNELPEEWIVGTAGGNKQLTELWVGTAGGNKQIFGLELQAPTGFAATALDDDTIRLNHNGDSELPDSYKVYWKAGSSMAGDLGNADGDFDIGLATQYDHEPLTDGVEYFYMIVAVRAAAESPPSHEVSDVTTLIRPVLTSAQKGSANPYTTADLVFTDGGSASETEIRVYLSTVSAVAGFSLWATLPANDTTETITGLQDDVQFWAKLVNYNAAYGESADSSLVDTFTTDRVLITNPPAWTSTFPKDDPSDDDSLLGEWTEAQKSDTTQVYFKLDSTFGDPANPHLDGTELQDSSDTDFDHSGAWSHGQEVFYTLRGRHATSDGPYSTPVSATVAIRVPGAPTIGTWSFDYGSLGATVPWTPGSPDNANHYKLESNRAPCGSGYLGWTPVAGTFSSSPATGVSVLEGNTYKFRAIAVNDAGDSDPSGESNEIVTAQSPNAPTNMTATKSGSNPTTEIDLTWTDPTTGTLDEIEIHRAATQFGSYSLRQTVAGSTEAWTDSVGDEETWWYKSRGTAGCGLPDGPFSTPSVGATTDAALPGVPAGITLVPKQGTDHQVTIDWTDAVDATDHDVFVSLSTMGADPTIGGTQVGGDTSTGPIDVDVASLLGATADDQIFVNVRGTNSGGDGDWGTEANGYTHREAPGLSTSEDYTNCPTSFDVTLNFTHINSDGDSRNTTIEWRRKVSGSWSSWFTKAGGSASHIDTGRTSTTTHYEARYQGESATSGEQFVTECPE